MSDLVARGFARNGRGAVHQEELKFNAPTGVMFIQSESFDNGVQRIARVSKMRRDIEIVH